ncbi:hypothetical protein K440DRAFT_643514 [Wilcoxina mikolae CBS 423.85]|nr:hypothetical protein K440DRAFT_643514 [Wilcoxina mikolae CBS 423.85]
MFSKNPKRDDPKGFVIDTDVAKNTSTPSADQMYVLFDGAGKVRKPRPTTLGGWSSKLAAGDKYRHMASGKSFERIFDPFSEGFAGLRAMMREWRRILFPLVNGEAIIGTFEDHELIYQELLVKL